MHLALPFCLLAVVLMAGCSTPPASTTDEPSPSVTVQELPPLEAPTVLPPVLLGTGAGEPNIAVAPDGTIYITPIDHVYRSEDGGKSFEDLGSGKTSGHGDGDIAVDGTGRLHWLGLGLGIPYQYSDDRGESFSKATDVSDETGNDREWIDVRPEGVVYASWRGSDEEGLPVISARTSFDHGQTWQDLVTMAPDAIGGPIVHGPRPGTVYEAMTSFDDPFTTAYEAQVLLARSSDDGLSWNLSTVVTPSQSVQVSLIGLPTSIFPVAAIDDNGTIYVVYSMDQRLLPESTPKPTARFGIFLSVSHDDGLTWTEPRLLSDADHASVMPWVAAGADGRIAVTWYENTAGLPNDNLPDAWNVMLLEAVAADTAMPQQVVAKLNDLPSHLGSICTAGTGCIAGGDRSLLDFFEVALDNAGQPVVTWVSTSPGTVFGPAVPVGPLDTQIYFSTVAGTPLR